MAHAQEERANSHYPSWDQMDGVVLELSKRITAFTELRTLASTGLKLPSHEVESAITNSSNNIQNAAYSVLQTWLKQQANGDVAYRNLVEALNRCDMTQLTSQLMELFTEPPSTLRMSSERVSNIQKWTKRSFERRPFCLIDSKDWASKSRKIELKELYIDLSLTQKIRKAHGVERKPIRDITQVLQHFESVDDIPQRVLVQAGGGMGKSTEMKHLAISWADGTSEELKKFDIVFHIALKEVKENNSIENIIIAQHTGLKANKVKPIEIKSILEGEKPCDGKVLLLIDGYDEYKPGTNCAIDKAIRKNTLWNCCLVLTSRETEEVSNVRDYMDTELEIHGFDNQNVSNYITKFLGSEHKTNELFEELVNNGLCFIDPVGGYIIDNFLAMPIFLNMICILFLGKVPLPKTATKVVMAVVNNAIDRETRRAGKDKEGFDANVVLEKLGKLAWEGLITKRFYFQKIQITEAAGEQALGLGVLIGMENVYEDDDDTEVLYFAYPLFQEFSAAEYIAKQSKMELNSLFSTWQSIVNHHEVVEFVAGLSEEQESLVETICCKFKEFLLTNYLRDDDIFLLQSIGREMGDVRKMLNNKYFNYTSTYSKVVYIPSEFYYFNDKSPDSKTVKYITDESSLKETQKAKCSVLVPTFAVQNALNILLEIQKKLSVSVVSFGLLEEVPKSSQNNIDDNLMILLKKTLYLSEDTLNFGIRSHFLSNVAYNHVARQLSRCKNLQILCLRNIPQNVPMKLSVAFKNLKSLESVDMQNSKMALLSCRSLLNALSCCSALRELNLDECKLTNCLEMLLGGVNHSGFHSLQVLNLGYTKLCKDDVEVIANAAKRGIVDRLSHLTLSGNSLTDCITTLIPLGNNHHPGFQSLQILAIADSKLSQDDISNLSHAKQLNKLPALTNLDIHANTLGGCMKKLFDSASGPGFHLLQELNVCSSGLSKTDLRDLAQSLKNVRPVNLLLGQNTLTGILGELFVGTRLLPVRLLDLTTTKLDRKDINSLSHAMWHGKLPHLEKLYLYGNNMRNMEAEFKNFLKVCTNPAYYKNSLLDIRISLNHYPNVKEFQTQIYTICQGTRVSVIWRELKKSTDVWGLQVGGSFGSLGASLQSQLKKCVVELFQIYSS